MSVCGIGGSATRTRGSVWFQVSGTDDGAEKIGVEAYVLNKITNDLPLEPIPLALKWEHLSDLKLADPEFRTPGRVDLLLGADVFTSILRDGRRTGPRGTPSALNTCFGWVLFGRIGDSDVVDVANHTLEEDVLKDITEFAYSYTGTVITNKEKDFHRSRRKNKNVGKPRGFGRRYVGARTPRRELCVSCLNRN